MKINIIRTEWRSIRLSVSVNLYKIVRLHNSWNIRIFQYEEKYQRTLEKI